MGRVTARLPDDVSAVGPQEEVRIGIGDLMDGCRRIEGNEKRVQGSRQVECPPSYGGHTMKRIPLRVSDADRIGDDHRTHTDRRLE